MIALISLSDAKANLNVLDTSFDTDITLKILQASAIVMTYIKKTSIPDEWIVNSNSPVTYDIPYDIQAATVLVLAELFLNRESSTSSPLSQNVKDLLAQYWDPALA